MTRAMTSRMPTGAALRVFGAVILGLVLLLVVLAVVRPEMMSVAMLRRMVPVGWFW